MKKAIVALTIALAGVAAADEYEVKNVNGETSYSYQSNVRSVTAKRQRNIPAPSAWTPPERIPSKPVAMVRRDQPKRLGGGFGFSIPTFSNPAFSNPGFTNPQFQNPGYTNPSFQNAGFSNPGYSNPGFTSPGLANPTFSNPGFTAPVAR